MSADEEGMDDARAEEDVYHVLTLSSVCSSFLLLLNFVILSNNTYLPC